MGYTARGEHGRRYDRADEFMEVVMGHWDAWEDRAIVADLATGLFAHPEKVHRLDHKGEFFQSGGPFTVPRFRPGPPGVDPGRAKRPGRALSCSLRRVRLRILPPLATGLTRLCIVQGPGRNRWPRSGKGLRLRRIYPVGAETRSEAEHNAALIDTTAKEIDSLPLLPKVLNFDFSKQPIDEPFTQQAIDSWTAMQGMPDRIRRELGDRLAHPARFHRHHPPWHHSRSAARRTSPTAWKRASRRAPATGSWSPRPTYPSAYEDFPGSSSPRTTASGSVPHRLQQSHLAQEPRPQSARDRGAE